MKSNSREAFIALAELVEAGWTIRAWKAPNGAIFADARIGGEKHEAKPEDLGFAVFDLEEKCKGATA